MHVFVGSSDPQRPLVTRLVKALETAVRPLPWWEAFPAGETTIGSLLSRTREVDLAVFVVTRDDLRWKAHDSTKKSSVVRDNVIFELGLFAGALGLERSIMFVDTALMPDRPKDLSGVTDVRWCSKDSPVSFDNGVAAIVTRAHDIFDDLGLGWWAIRFENDIRRGRATYGVFEIQSEGSQLIVRYGNTYYSESNTTAKISHQQRSSWESRTVSLVRRGEGQSSLVVLAEVTSLAPTTDPDRKARETSRLQTLFEVHQTSADETYRGRYFDVQGLDYSGRVVAHRLGNCDGQQALDLARTKLGGVVA